MGDEKYFNNSIYRVDLTEMLSHHATSTGVSVITQRSFLKTIHRNTVQMAG